MPNRNQQYERNQWNAGSQRPQQRGERGDGGYGAERESGYGRYGEDQEHGGRQQQYGVQRGGQYGAQREQYGRPGQYGGMEQRGYGQEDDRYGAGGYGFGNPDDPAREASGYRQGWGGQGYEGQGQDWRSQGAGWGNEAQDWRGQEQGRGWRNQGSDSRGRGEWDEQRYGQGRGTAGRGGWGASGGQRYEGAEWMSGQPGGRHGGREREQDGGFGGPQGWGGQGGARGYQGDSYMGAGMGAAAPYSNLGVSGQGWERTGSQAGRGPSMRGRGPKGYQRSDERLKEMICERLSDDPDIDPSDVSLEVKNGEVTLEGQVEDRATKYQIEELVDGCGGVREVHNRLRVASRQGMQAGGASAHDQGRSEAESMSQGMSQSGEKGARKQ